jgi:lipopolysaccharide biosynthesis protein
MKIPRFIKTEHKPPEHVSPSDRYLFKVDEPRQKQISDRRVVVRGWILPKEGVSIRALRLIHSGHVNEVSYGFERRDILQSFPDVKETSALKSGFEVKYEFVEGPSVLEVDFGNGFEVLEDLDLQYIGDKPLAENYNPHLATNYAEHIDLRKVQQSYFYESAIDRRVVLRESDPRLVAFYLPQFHPIAENDKAWGKGFTEWTNVTAAQPRFVGHNQPMLPGDLGYYDLRLEENIYDQIQLAKNHGIYGFCIYYYWFSGKKILDKPIESILKHKEWDFNFMICWANENWTKRWDGHDRDVIIAQKYLDSDALDFIKEVEHILLDPRYIRHEGKPVLSIYRPEKLKNPSNFATIWQQYFKKKHNLELHLISVLGFEERDPSEYQFNGAVDFVPLSIDFKAKAFEENKVPQISVADKLLDNNYEGAVYDYRKVVLNDMYQTSTYKFHTYRSVMPSWDNDARKKGKGSSFYNNNPDLYGKWLKNAIDNREGQSDPIFINAWNEWAEGAVLEPTMHFGHAMLNRTAEVISSYGSSNKKIFPEYGIKRSPHTKLAVVVHLYYPEQWEYIKERLRHFGSVKFDLFVNLQPKDKDFIKEIKRYHSGAYVSILENRGRDILPFIHLARRLDEKGYTSILKLHTKKSKHREDGDEWFKELIDSLLPSREAVKQTLEQLEGNNVIIGPEGHYVSFQSYIGSNEARIKELVGLMYGNDVTDGLMHGTSDYGYFGGSMFWISIDLLRPLLNLYLMPEDFESEAGQIDGTLAHAIERIIGLMAHHQTARILKIGENGVSEARSDEITSDYRYAK